MWVIWAVDRLHLCLVKFMLPLHEDKRLSSTSAGDRGCCQGVAGLQEVSARDSPRGEFPTGAMPPTLLQYNTGHFGTWVLYKALY